MVNKDYMQIGIALFVAGIIAFLIVQFTGVEEGMLSPKVMFAFFSGVFATKIVDFVYATKAKPPAPKV